MAILDYLIPGYKGYRLRDESRETDKLFRQYISNLLQEDHQTLESIKVDLTRTGNLMSLNPAEDCTKTMTRVRDKLRFANYGFSALFEKGQQKVDHQRLERVEGHDKQLIDQREMVKQQIGQIRSMLDEGGKVDADLRKLLTLLRQMDETLNAREEIIRGNV